MKTQVKICGIKTLAAAEAVIAAGGDFIGLNFITTSKNYLAPKKAREIVKKIKGRIQTVGIFQDQEAAFVNRIISNLGLDLAQLHGQESVDYCRQIQSKIIKAFALDYDFDVESTVKNMSRYEANYYLVDRKKQGQGEKLKSAKLKKLSEIFPIFIAGGLTPENVKTIIEEVKPFAVDVAGGVQACGKTDPAKIHRFITNSKSYVF